MMRKYNRLGLFGIMAVGFLISGCLLISGTFVIVEDFSFSGETGFYHYWVDLTNEEDWEDHKDDIDDIDLVGFEMNFTNNDSEPVTFNAYIDDGGEFDVWADYAEVDANAVKILDNLTLPVGKSHLTYGDSFKYIMNVEAMKKLVKKGQFHFYGVSEGGISKDFVIDSGKVVVTFTAHGS